MNGRNVEKKLIYPKVLRLAKVKEIWTCHVEMIYH